MKSRYVCPITRDALREEPSRLVRDDGVFYPLLTTVKGREVPHFTGNVEPDSGARQSLVMYDQEASVRKYRNFLAWLFETFGENEQAFRKSLMRRLGLAKGGRLLITGCGLGEDIVTGLEFVGSEGEVYANDLAAEMVIAAADLMAQSSNVHLAVCDAQLLPFENDYFDAAFHFGGINLFDNVGKSIAEMNRVVRPGGRVLFGDEGVAPWLRNTDYGRAAINNNAMWGASAPLALLPETATDVHLSWVLGNCFYVIDFAVSSERPHMNMDVRHLGSRGGTMRTRYFGQLEGVAESTREFVIKDAERQGVSVHDWLEQAINERRR